MMLIMHMLTWMTDKSANKQWYLKQESWMMFFCCHNTVNSIPFERGLTQKNNCDKQIDGRHENRDDDVMEYLIRT